MENLEKYMENTENLEHSMFFVQVFMVLCVFHTTIQVYFVLPLRMVVSLVVPLTIPLLALRSQCGKEVSVSQLLLTPSSSKILASKLKGE